MFFNPWSFGASWQGAEVEAILPQGLKKELLLYRKRNSTVVVHK